MIKSPIWKDIEYHNDNFSTLDYYIADEDGNILHRGYTMRMPDQTGITININNRLEEYLNPEFDSDIREADDNIVSNSNAYKNFQMRDKPVQGLIGEFGFLYDWSYEDRWTGQTKYLMTEPINGHIDSRMKSMFTMMNTAETNFNWEIQYDSQLELNPSKLFFDVSGGTSSVTVSSNECWEITSMPSWITASVTSDCGSYSSITVTNITFSAETYSGTDDRVGSIVFTTPGGTTILPVTQGKYVTVSVLPSSLSYIYSGETKIVTITSNGFWNVVSKPDWINIPVPSGTGDGRIQVSAIANPDHSERNGTIVIETKSETVTITVSQEAKPSIITITPESQLYAESGETKSFTVYCDTNWSVSSKPAWATTNVTGGTSGTTTLNVTVPQYVNVGGRIGNLVVSGINASATAVLNQAGEPLTLTVTPSSVVWTEFGGSQTISITSNYGWEISGHTSLDWITFSQTSKSGSGTTTVTMTVPDIGEGSTRSGSFVVFNPECSVVVNVMQTEFDENNWIRCTYNLTRTGVTTNGLTRSSYDQADLSHLASVMIVDGVRMDVRSYDAPILSVGEHTALFRSLDGHTGAKVWYGLGNGLESVYIPDNVKYIDANAFNGNNITSVTFNENSQLETIDDGAFEGNEFTSFNIPDGVKTIGGYAFSSCQDLQSIEIPDSVTSIGTYAFNSCTSLTDVEILRTSNLNNIGGGAFGGTPIQSFYVPYGVTSLTGTFSACTSLTSVTFASDSRLITLGEKVFFNTSVKDVVIPDTVTSIGNKCFATATTLTGVTIGSSVASLGSEAFAGCSSLVYIKAKPTTAPSLANSWVFRYVKYYGFLEYPQGSNYSAWLSSSSYYLGYYRWNEFVVTPNALTFGYQGGTKSVTVSSVYSWTATTTSETLTIQANSTGFTVTAAQRSGVADYNTTIVVTSQLGISVTVSVLITGRYHLSVDYNITETGSNRIVSDEYTRITNYRYGSETPQQVHIAEMYVDGVQQPSSTTYNFTTTGSHNVTFIFEEPIIPASLLYEITSATHLKFGGDVYRIAPTAFEGCTGLVGEVVLPDATICKCAFNGCTNITEFTIYGMLRYIDDQQFRSCTSLRRVNVSPGGVYGIAPYMFLYCVSLVEAPQTKESTYAAFRMGKGAFEGCTNLRTLVFPPHMVQVPEAVMDASGVKTLYIYAHHWSHDQVTADAKAFLGAASNGTMYRDTNVSLAGSGWTSLSRKGWTSVNIAG